jgi:hypothetical protein
MGLLDPPLHVDVVALGWDSTEGCLVANPPRRAVASRTDRVRAATAESPRTTTAKGSMRVPSAA